MATTKNSDGNVLSVPSPSGRTVNGIVEFGTDAGGFGGIALKTVASGVACPVAITGVHNLTKATTSGEAWSQGVPIYHAGSNIVTDIASSNHLIGVAADTVVAADTTAEVLLSVGAIGG